MATYVLVVLAALPQTTFLQWIQVIIYIASMAAFARGAWILAQRYVATELPEVQI
jgi:hypothetical protein